MKGIIAYTDRGDELLSHHRTYLRKEWDTAWLDQVDDSVKEEIKEWLIESPI
jgi:hypothetical protein